MPSPLFSAVIPVYNRAGLIRTTLDSVFAQNRPELDVVVVDDGSTDATVSVLRSYGDRITLVQQDNSGPGAARNAGIAAAQGEYIAFLDSDDLWFPWTLAVYETIIRQHDSPSFLAGNPFLFRKEEDLADVPRQAPTTTAFPDYLASGDKWRWWGASSFVVRRTALQDADGFTNKWVNAEDADLTLRLGTAPGFVDVYGAPTFAYREHDGTAMDVSENTLKGAFHLVESERDGRYPGGPSRQRERRRILSRHLRPTMLDSLAAGRHTEAWHLYRATLPWHTQLGRWKFLVGFLMRDLQSRLLAPSTS